jgi:magnesium chelatase family protein
LTASELERVATLDRDGQKLLKAAVETLGLSARAYVKVLRVARTVADLEAEHQVREPHLAEAIQGRLFDREAAR